MKGNPKQDDPLIQNLHDAGCSQHIIDLHKDQNKLDCLDYLLFQLKKGC